MRRLRSSFNRAALLIRLFDLQRVQAGAEYALKKDILGKQRNQSGGQPVRFGLRRRASAPYITAIPRRV